MALSSANQTCARSARNACWLILARSRMPKKRWSFSRPDGSGSWTIYQDVYFTDVDGDAEQIHYELIRSTTPVNTNVSRKTAQQAALKSSIPNSYGNTLVACISR